MGRHRRSPVVRDAAITRRTSHSSTIFAAAGQMAGASSASSASARCPSFIYGSSYTDSSSLASSFADSSSAGFLSSCSSTYNHTLSLGSRTSSFSTTDLSDSETPSTDLLSEANIDSCLSETADSVDNSEASDDDAEPDEEDDDGEPYNDDNGVRGASLRLPQHQWYAREIIGAGSGIGRGGGGYKKNTHKDEQELSPEEQALLADFQRQLDDFLQKRVTVHYSIIIIFYIFIFLSILHSTARVVWWVQEVKYVDRAPVSGTVDGLVAALFHDDDAMGATLFSPHYLPAWVGLTRRMMLCFSHWGGDCRSVVRGPLPGGASVLHRPAGPSRATAGHVRARSLDHAAQQEAQAPPIPASPHSTTVRPRSALYFRVAERTPHIHDTQHTRCDTTRRTHDLEW
jgi:hypothetical protein